MHYNKIMKPGTLVRLISLPDGCSSKFSSLTLGSCYEFLCYDGSNIVTTTDVDGETASYWRGRVQIFRNSEREST